MYDFSRASDTERYLSRLLDRIPQGVFTLQNPSWGKGGAGTLYNAHEDVYVLFDNGMCLQLSFGYVDLLRLQYRRLSREEQTAYSTDVWLIKDCFNRSTKIFDPIACETYCDTAALEYDRIVEIRVEPCLHPYERWFGGRLVERQPTEETFCKLHFVMANGNSIVFWPGGAYSGGDTYFTAE